MAEVEKGRAGVVVVVGGPEVDGLAGRGGLRLGGGGAALLVGARDGAVLGGVDNELGLLLGGGLVLAVGALQLLGDLGEEGVRGGEAEELCGGAERGRASDEDEGVLAREAAPGSMREKLSRSWRWATEPGRLRAGTRA